MVSYSVKKSGKKKCEIRRSGTLNSSKCHHETTLEHPRTFYTEIPFLGEISWAFLIVLKAVSTDFCFSQYWYVDLYGLQSNFGHLHFAQMAVIHDWDELKCNLPDIDIEHRK